MFNVSVYQFTYTFLFLSIKFDKIKDDSTLLIAYFSLISLAPCDIFVLRFTSRMWDWDRCVSLLIYVVVDNQIEK